MKHHESKVAYVVLPAADLTAEAVMSQAWADYDMGRLTLRGAMDYLTVLVKGGYGFAADRRRLEIELKCGDKLRELCDTADNVMIRPGRDGDYRHVADFLSID